MDISPGPKSLLFDKHIEYIANHGNDKDDYVSIDCVVNEFNLDEFESISPGILHDRISSHVRHLLGHYRARFDGPCA